jgi:uncharacterized protein involved in exopolysaccharide biosynthesis
LEVTETAAKAQRELIVEPEVSQSLEPLESSAAARDRMLARLRLLWAERRFLLRALGVGLVAATLIAFLIPKQFESTTRLMPPDSQSVSSLALLAGLSGQGGVGMLAGDLLGIKSTGALFVGVLRSQTVQDRIIDRFDLKKVYGKRLKVSAREKLSERTAIGEDRKSGIITLTLTDRDPKRARAIAGAYVDELDTLMAQLMTSSAHRERVFLEERLSAVKQDLESAEKDFSQFASKNATIDITEQGKAMVEAAAALEGQLIAAQSELEGLKQIYTNNNVRVRSTQARIDELRHQLERLGGKSGTAPSGNETTADPLYPSIRQLPILGVPYADKFRRLKLEEAVYETLTKQYELAKVQEAKEIPTVKVLDPPEVPEKRSFPPRTLIVVLGTLGTVTLGVFWVLGAARWQEIDPQDPGRMFAKEVFQTVKAHMPWTTPNGSRWSASVKKLEQGPGEDGEPGA